MHPADPPAVDLSAAAPANGSGVGRGVRRPLPLAGWPLVAYPVDGAWVVGRLGVVLLTLLLRLYRVAISPLLGPRCRFHPTCSAYAIGALREHGLPRGTLMTLVRLARCGPWHPGGLDPVPRRPQHRPAGPGAPTTEEHAH